jgi:SET domain-containing protein
MSNYYLKTTTEMGRGLYSTNNIKKDKILFTAELLVLSPEDTKKVNETDLKYYTFVYNETQDCLVLGDGEIFNHSESANIGYKIIDFDDRKVMAFYTLRDVEQHEQLFIDYSADSTTAKPEDYTINLIG